MTVFEEYFSKYMGSREGFDTFNFVLRDFHKKIQTVLTKIPRNLHFCGGGGEHDPHRAHDLRSSCRVADTGRNTAGWYPPMEQEVRRTIR